MLFLKLKGRTGKFKNGGKKGEEENYCPSVGALGNISLVLYD